MTHDELVEKALAETGAFVVYGNTSRITTAAEAFAELYNITVEPNNLTDRDIYTKLRSSSVFTDNLTVAQYDAAANGYTVEPFAGFMYPMYTMINTRANRPYTGMLFIEYLMSQECFKPWGKNIGAYSPNAAIPVNDGDLTIDVWKDALVMEDAEYILDNFDTVRDFVLLHCH